MNGLIVGASIATVFVLGRFLFCIEKFTRKRHGISPGDILHQDHLKHRLTHFDTSQAPVVSTINREL